MNKAAYPAPVNLVRDLGIKYGYFKGHVSSGKVSMGCCNTSVLEFCVCFCKDGLFFYELGYKHTINRTGNGWKSFARWVGLTLNATSS